MKFEITKDKAEILSEWSKQLGVSETDVADWAFSLFEAAIEGIKNKQDIALVSEDRQTYQILSLDVFNKLKEKN